MKSFIQLYLVIITILEHIHQCRSFTITTERSNFIPNLNKLSHTKRTPKRRATLQASLKPLAIPLMDSGKALARGGEFIIDATSQEFQIYGGALSAAGANIRNAGDCIAQAAASCRFKTGVELVIDELREASSCLDEAGRKLSLAVEEADVVETGKDEIPVEVVLPDVFGRLLEYSIEPIYNSHLSLEAAGASILKRQSLAVIGNEIIQTSISLQNFSTSLALLSDIQVQQGKESQHNIIMASQRIQYAALKMKEAGESLVDSSNGTKKKIQGKGWIKGGM